MLLNAVIIVLREVLEAALLISILTALSGMLNIRSRWIPWSLLAGIAGAVALGSWIDRVSTWFGGVGQEVFSAGIQLLIYLLLGLFIFLILLHRGPELLRRRILMRVMSVVVALAVIREGFEVLVYLYGFALQIEQLVTALVGAAIGAGIGISVGVLLYYLLHTLPTRWALGAGLLLMVLVASGLLSQAALLLIQADWLPSQLPIWDTSAVLPEDSVAGQLLYALIGYEATPTAIQAGCYFGGGLLLVIAAFIASRCCRSGEQA